MCIQKLFIPIKMMYSGIKWMVLCIAYILERVNALKSRRHEESATCAARTGQLSLWLWLCYVQGMACNRKLEKSVTPGVTCFDLCVQGCHLSRVSGRARILGCCAS